MTKEEYLKGLILQRWTLKDFAAKINMPYGTLYSILKNVDGGSMYNIVKICSGLHISTDELVSDRKAPELYPAGRQKYVQHKRTTGSEIYPEQHISLQWNGIYSLREKTGYAVSNHPSCTERKNTVAPASYFSRKITALPAYLIQTGRRKHTQHFHIHFLCIHTFTLSVQLFIFRPNQAGLGFLYHNLHIVLPKGNHRRITGNKLSTNRITPAKPKASKIYPHNTKSVPSQIYNQEETFLFLYLICTIWVVPIIFHKFRHIIGNGSNQPVLSYSETPLLQKAKFEANQAGAFLANSVHLLLCAR